MVCRPANAPTLLVIRPERASRPPSCVSPSLPSRTPSHGRYANVHLVHHGVRPPPLLPPYPHSLTPLCSANRGIGLELTKQLLESPANTVLAACRNPAGADALNALAQSDTGMGHVHVLPLEITDRESVRDAVRAVGEIVGEKGLDYLVNNAAVVRPLFIA